MNCPAQKKLCPGMYHYFMKIPYPNDLFIIKNISLITLICVIFGVLNGFALKCKCKCFGYTFVNAFELI